MKILPLLLLGLAGCQPTEAPPETALPPDFSILESGLTEQHDLARFPVGEVEIKGAAPYDWQRLVFPLPFLNYLERAEKAGLLTLDRHERTVESAEAGTSSLFITATPTEKLLKLRRPAQGDQPIVAVPVGTMKVLEIVSDRDYASALGQPGDRFHLVEGRLEDNPTPAADSLSSLGVSITRQKFRFRALLRRDPGGRADHYIAADLGRPDEAGWQSRTVR